MTPIKKAEALMTQLFIPMADADYSDIPNTLYLPKATSPI
jgi:hypothetical protein